jgi:phospholipid-binding lipoprotein MlaA
MIKHTFTHSLILSAVIVFFPSILQADASSAAPAMVQSDEQETIHVPHVFTETDGDAREPSVTVSTQQDDADVKEAQEPAAVESEDLDGEAEEEVQQIPDPLAPLNKVMFHFNDKLYFWALKPVTQLYSHIIPEDFRIVFGNAYDNLWAPARMVNNLLQLRFKSAGSELIRFLFNSVAGIGGLTDFAKDAFGIKKQEADFGQTLGHYGIGHGFYLILPVFGPSSLRDGIGLAGDRFMYPLTYVSRSDLTLGETAEIFAHEKVNDTSFRIGDYESFKESAINPYVSMRDAFVQYRKKKVEESNR